MTLKVVFILATTAGKVVSGWRVRDKNNWKLIGKKNPQLPQMFYPVDNEMTIRKGDTVAARCTMVNNRDRYTNQSWNSWTSNKQKTRVFFFVICYSQPFLLADFKENHTLLWF
jgi:hypothetical protein